MPSYIIIYLQKRSEPRIRHCIYVVVFYNCAHIDRKSLPINVKIVVISIVYSIIYYIGYCLCTKSYIISMYCRFMHVIIMLFSYVKI